MGIYAFAQDREVKGVVTDKDGAPLQGVTIVIKGTTNSVTTNEKGLYRLMASPEQTLVFSFISFATKEVKVGDHPLINIAMERADNQLDDVIVIGYGSQKKIHLTGSVATVDIKHIEDLPAGNMSALLRGQMPGVSVAGGYSRPGSPAVITIRNPVYFAKDGPRGGVLYIIDDIIRSVNDFNLLDPSEIESLSILKDAAAAIYGIQGANGVVIIKTKRGKAGSAKVNYSSYYGVTDAVKMPKMMSGYEQAVYLNDLNIAGGKDTGNTVIYSPDELEYFKANNNNWLNMAWQKAFETRQAVSVSGGTEKVTYFAGFSYNTQNGNFPNINYNKYTFRASTDFKIATGLKLGLSLSGGLSDNKQIYSKIGGESVDNDWKTLTLAPQFNPPYVDGLPIMPVASGNVNVTDNYHYFAIQNSGAFTQSKPTVLNFQGQLSYEIPFIKGLTAGVNFNKNINNEFGKQYGTYYNAYTFSMLGGHKHIYGGDVLKKTALKNGDIVRLNPTVTNNYQLNASVRYDRQFGKHQIGILGVYEQSETFSDGVAGSVESVIVGGLPNTRYATGAVLVTETQSEVGRLAYLGRFDYNYASKYLVQFQWRADASTYFASENRWGYFSSVSLGWVISEEGFFRGALGAVNFLKLRASAGYLGSDNTKGYTWLRSYKIETGKAPVFGGNTERGLAVSPDVSVANRDVHWDNDDKYNVGIDAKFLNNRLSLTAEGFFDHRTDQLTSLTSSVSQLIGATLPTENFSESNNFGYEISLGWRDNINKDWSYNVNTFLTWMDNKLLKSDFPVGNIGTYLDPTGRSSDLGYYGYHHLGMFRTKEQLDQFMAENPSYTILGKKPELGMLYYADVRGPKDASGKYTGPDGKITEEDQDYLTYKSDNHYGLGFNWGVNYKTVSLNVVMGLSFGGKGAVESSARSQATATSNRPAFWADHYSPDNINAKYPNPYYKDYYNIPSSFWLRSSTTFRVASFNLSYALPNHWAQKARMSSAKLVLTGTNPLNFYNPYDYKDNSGSYDAYPNLKTFALGLNANF